MYFPVLQGAVLFSPIYSDRIMAAFEILTYFITLVSTSDMKRVKVFDLLTWFFIYHASSVSTITHKKTFRAFLSQSFCIVLNNLV